MRAWGIGVCCLLLPAFASGQSLAETARKERERRDTLRDAGRDAPTLTEADLAASAGRVANDRDEGDSAADEERAERPDRVRSLSRSGDRDSERDSRAEFERHWRERAVDARLRLEEAERRYRGLDRMIRIGQGARYDENGRRVILSGAELKRRADEAQAELAAAREAFEELRKEGRRAGALPGWFR
jgi:hypothetical protein